jgi:uncharacterized membrane protein YsdA (DUF1294 family)
MKYRNPYKIYFSIAGGLFIGTVCFLLWVCLKAGIDIRWFNLWFWLLYFLAINFTVGFLYLWDKVSAVGREDARGYKIIAGNNKITRVPEIVLHSLSLLGGSPMALLSQKLFRHKISKKSFIITYWLIVLLQAGVVVYFLQ